MERREREGGREGGREMKRGEGGRQRACVRGCVRGWMRACVRAYRHTTHFDEDAMRRHQLALLQLGVSELALHIITAPSPP